MKSSLLFSVVAAFSTLGGTASAEIDYNKHTPPEVFIYPTPREENFGPMDIELAAGTIVISEKANEKIRIAAEDLNANLLRLFPKAKVFPITTVMPAGNATVIIMGETRKFGLLDQRLKAENILMSRGEPGPEGYRIVTRQEGKRTAILLAGSDDQGVYWAMTSFVQLLRSSADGKLMAYRSNVRDWPAFKVRMISLQVENSPEPTRRPRIDMGIRLRTNASFYSGYHKELNDYCRKRGFKTGTGYWVMQNIGKLAGQLNLQPNCWSDPRLLQAWVDQFRGEAGAIPGQVIYHDATDAGWWNRYYTDHWLKRSEADKKAYPQAHPGWADADRFNALYRGIKELNPDIEVYLTVPCYYDSPQDDTQPNIDLFRDYLRTIGRLTPRDVVWVLEDRTPEDCVAYQHYLGGRVMNYRYPAATSGVEMWSTTFTASKFNVGFIDSYFYNVGHPYQDLMLACSAEYLWNPETPADYSYITEKLVPKACKVLYGRAWRPMADFFINNYLAFNGLSEGKNVNTLRVGMQKIELCKQNLAQAKKECDTSLPSGQISIDVIQGYYNPVSEWLGPRLSIIEAYTLCQKAEMMIALGDMAGARPVVTEAIAFLKKAETDNYQKLGLKKDFDESKAFIDKLNTVIQTGKVSPSELGVLKLDGPWRILPDPKNEGIAKEYFAEKIDRSKWYPISVPGFWEMAGISEMSDYDGYGWYARTFSVPAAWKGKAVILHVDGVDDESWVYLNGKLIGEHTYKQAPPHTCWEQPFEFDITSHIGWSGENTVVIRVNDTKMSGGLWKSVWLRADAPGKPLEGPGMVEVKAESKK